MKSVEVVPAPKTPRCQFNNFVDCTIGEQTRGRCKTCGWNPKVETERKEARKWKKQRPTR